MGAALEYVIHDGAVGAEEAYRELVEQARFEDGHSAYSGTIATSHGFFVAQSAPVPRREAEEIVGHLSEQGRLAKWSQWAAIPLADGERTTIERRISVTDPTPESITEAVRARVPSSLLYDGHDLTDIQVTYRAPETRAAGRSTKVWVVRGGRDESVHPTRAAATAAAREVLAAMAERSAAGRTWWSPSLASPLQVTVTPELRDDDGEPARIEVVRRPRRLVATAKINVARRTTVQTGWLFGGWAAM